MSRVVGSVRGLKSRHIGWLVVGAVLSGCAAPREANVVAGFTAVQSGLFVQGLTEPFRPYEEGEYLPGALPNVQAFTGYAGYIVTYYGPRSTAGTGCDDLASARRDIGHESMMLVGQKAATQPPNGKFEETILTSAYQAKAGILGFFSAEASDSTSVQLLVQDVAAQTAVEVLDEAKIARVKRTDLPSSACARKIIRSASLTEATARRYHSVGKSPSFSGFNINIGGKWHNSTEEFHRELFVRIETSEL